MKPIAAILLGAVQGLTEFLPISSTAHLTFAEQLLKVPAELRLSLDILLHIGTALALLIFFAPQIMGIIRGGVSSSAARRRASWYLILVIGIGTIPAGIVGCCAREQFERLFADSRYPAVFLLITGLVLYLTRYAEGARSVLTWRDGLIIGCAQALALLPGISRSGMTIAAALFIGLARPQAFEYSFLLSIPAVLGAGLLELRSTNVWGASGLSLPVALVSVAASCISGLAALLILRRLLLQQRFWWFAFYCWVLGLAVLGWTVFRLPGGSILTGGQ